MMKRYAVPALIVVLLMMLSLTACGGTDTPVVDPNTSAATTTATTVTITEEEAKTVALEDAGLTADAVERLMVTYDLDDGVPEYHVEFYEGGTEYEYEIHAETGTIRSRDIDRTDDGVLD